MKEDKNAGYKSKCEYTIGNAGERTVLDKCFDDFLLEDLQFAKGAVNFVEVFTVDFQQTRVVDADANIVEIDFAAFESETKCVGISGAGSNGNGCRDND